MSRRYACVHLAMITDIPISELVKSKEGVGCSDCSCYGPNLWICLYRDCLRIGCSENFNDHSTIHNRLTPSHCIHMNLTTQRIWCYMCQSEVFMDGKRMVSSLTVVYGDSDNEPEQEPARAIDRESFDSGRSSYTLVRPTISRPGTEATFTMDKSVNVGMRGDSDNETEQVPVRTVPRPGTDTVFLLDKCINVGMSGDSGESSDSDDVEHFSKPRGLVGLQNIGNTCYMNAALQALSNTPPLTSFFLDCVASVRLASEGRKPGLSRSYQRLVREMWHRKTRSYVVPSGILYGIRNVHSMFRGYHQHDTQEFLRCFMDQLHEELKESPESGELSTPLIGSCDTLDSYSLAAENPQSPEQAFGYVTTYEPSNCDGTSASASQSEGEYETCDSGVSERSSLSDDTERSIFEGRRLSMGAKRRLSRSGSPARQSRLRSKLTSTHCRSMSPPVVESQPSTSSNVAQSKKPLKYRSIISDVFDGKLLSSVQCLTCNRISTRVETFQDLSLPIPNRDHLAVLHGTGLTGGKAASVPPQSAALTCTEVVYPGSQDGWVAWLWTWLKSWFYGPTVSLHDCLAAFFSADELKGDNMYSCEKCNKLRNGVKYSKVIDLPEVLCIHLKRFRHELMFSSKISSQVSFPLTGLDMRPYLHKECVSAVSGYDLISVICHHGTAGGGHYTCYSLNSHSDAWFEFDDQYVTQVPPDTVLTCEAYVLFYRKSNSVVTKSRQRTAELMEASAELSEIKFYVSRRWISKFNTFAEPGPIDNSDFLCAHGGVIPERDIYIEQLSTIVSQSVWEYLYETFGGGPSCNHLYECPICEQAAEALNKRITLEMDTFRQLNQEFQNMESATTVYAISMHWFRQWQSFVRTKCEPPGPIDNSSIANQQQPGQETVKPGSDYAQISEELWLFFHQIYGGGPELRIRSSKTPPAPQQPQLQPRSSQSTYESSVPNETVVEFFIPPLKPKKHYDNEEYKQMKNIAPVHEPKSMYSMSEPMNVADNKESMPESSPVADAEAKRADSIESEEPLSEVQPDAPKIDSQSKEAKGKKRLKYKKSKSRNGGQEKCLSNGDVSPAK